MDQVAQVFLLLGKQIKGERLAAGWGAAGKGWGGGIIEGGAPGPHLPAPGKPGPTHLALQVDTWVAVGEVLPEQQRVFVLLPRQAVTVVVKVKGLPPGGGDKEGGTEREPGSRAQDGRETGCCPSGCVPKETAVWQRGRAPYPRS